MAFKYCKGKKGERKGRECWCPQPFCYVDPSCESAVKSRLFPEVQDLYYSYATCVGEKAGEQVQTCLDDNLQEEQEVLVRTHMTFSADNRGIDDWRTFNINGNYQLSAQEGWKSDADEVFPRWDNCFVRSCTKFQFDGAAGSVRGKEVASGCELGYDANDSTWAKQVILAGNSMAHIECYVGEAQDHAMLMALY